MVRQNHQSHILRGIIAEDTIHPGVVTILFEEHDPIAFIDKEVEAKPHLLLVALPILVVYLGRKQRLREIGRENLSPVQGSNKDIQVTCGGISAAVRRANRRVGIDVLAPGSSRAGRIGHAGITFGHVVMHAVHTHEIGAMHAERLEEVLADVVSVRPA